jgi:ABC-type antimicrobial peptide transport system permease subunit
LILEARVAADASERDVMHLVTRLVRNIDPLVAPPRTQPLVEMQKLALLPARAGAAILGGIGAIAFVLAAVGVGGVAAYTVAQRTREIGVRMALGASPASLLRGLLHETWTTVLRGAVVGLVFAIGVGRLLASQLYGVSFADPVTFAIVPVLLLILAVAAAFVPARRALRVSPIEALRSE